MLRATVSLISKLCGYSKTLIKNIQPQKSSQIVSFLCALKPAATFVAGSYLKF
tara:strand:+ start:2743 stop:2901 length:159 start_codon:yes stop_codon:yes gene_type:complete